MNKRYMDKLVALHACREASEWVATQETPQKAWDACERGDWMLWYCGKLSGAPEGNGRKRLVLAACECARLSLKYVKAGEDRPLVAIDTAERWANGKATIAEVRAAYAAYAAADAAARNKVLAQCADIVRRHYPKPPMRAGR